jgi:hypothetical protein
MCYNFPPSISKQVMLCTWFYGSMLWGLSSEMAGQFFRSWNTSVKLSWNVPRATHTYLVNHLLAIHHASFREQLLVRYLKFFQKLRNSNSAPVKLLANVVARDIRSTTGKNLHLIEAESGLDPWTSSEQSIRESLTRTPVPNEDLWRLPLLCQNLAKRREMEALMENTDYITDLIDSLCI